MASCKCNGRYGRFDLLVPASRTASLGIPGIAVLTQPKGYGYIWPGRAVAKRYAAPGMAVLTQGGYGRARRGYGADDVVSEGQDANAGGKPSAGEVILGIGENVRDVVLGILSPRTATEAPAFEPSPPAPAPTSNIGPIVAIAGLAALGIGAFALMRK